MQLGRRRDEGEEPVQLVGKRSDRGRRSGWSRGAVLGAEEAPAESVDRPACEVCAFAEMFSVRLQKLRHGAQGAGSLTLEVGAPASRPEEHDGANPGAGREAPTLEAVGNRGVRRRNRHRQHECEERSGRARREVAAERAREERGETDERHRACGEQRGPRTE